MIIFDFKEQLMLFFFCLNLRFNLYFIFNNGELSLYNEDDACLGKITLATDKESAFGSLSMFKVHYGFDILHEWSITNFTVEDLSN